MSQNLSIRLRPSSVLHLPPPPPPILPQVHPHDEAWSQTATDSLYSQLPGCVTSRAGLPSLSLRSHCCKQTAFCKPVCVNLPNSSVESLTCNGMLSRGGNPDLKPVCQKRR